MKIENDLGRDDIRRLVLRLAIPSMLAQFINVLYSVVDRIYIGNIPVIGETALAGVGVSGPGRSGRLAAHEHPYGRGAG